jgi:valyl-tRNA synthetase
LRQIIGKNGRLLPVQFGSEGWESLDAAQANHFYSQLEGLTVAQAQKKITQLLSTKEAISIPSLEQPPLRDPPKSFKHSVKFYEKGSRPLEIVTTRQWFVRILDKKDALLSLGKKINWVPKVMQKKYIDW